MVQNMRPIRVQLLVMPTSEHQNDSVIVCCESLLTLYCLVPFLDRLVSGDEEWILYRNVKRRRQ